MRKSRFTEEQMIALLQEAETGAVVRDLCRRHGIIVTTFYRGRTKYGGIGQRSPPAQAARGGEPPAETNRRRLSAQSPGAEGRAGKRIPTAGERHVIERIQAAADISERRATRFTGFARSTMRYRSVREPQDALRARIRELADQRKRWGYRMIHTVLRSEGWPVNRKRVQRLYREEGLAVRRRGKKRRSQSPRPVRPALAV